MQNHFSFSRFGRLFKKYTLEHYKENLMSVAVLIGILSLLMGIDAYFSKQPLGEGNQSVYYMLGFMAAGTVYTSMIFSDLSNKNTAIATLTLPASHFEKYILGWLYSFVFFILIYTLAFYLVTSIVIQMDDWHGEPKELLNVLAPVKENRVIHIFWIFTFFHAISIWGAIFFRKMHFIKTGFTVFLAIVLLALINYLFMGLLFDKEIQSAIPFGSVVLKEAADQKINIRLPDDSDNIKINAFLFIAILMWVASYLRLKEKQV